MYSIFITFDEVDIIVIPHYVDEEINVKRVSWLAKWQKSIDGKNQDLNLGGSKLQSLLVTTVSNDTLI